MKVVILNNDFRVYWKGRLIYLHQFLRSHNIEFHAIELFGKGSPYSFDEYNNTENWWSCLFPNQSSGDIPRPVLEQTVFTTLDNIKPDFVIASSIVFYAGALGIRWAKKNKKRFIMFDDARAGQVKRMAIIQWIKNHITKQADALWFPSKIYKRDFSIFDNKKTHFFYGFSCIDNQFFKPARPNTFTHKVIICVARLVPIKNIDTLLQAWSIVEKTGNNYRLAIVGDGPLQGSLASLKDDLHLSTVDLLGVVNNDKLASFYNNADAFILPSISETWGLVVNEAMAAGLPVLLSNGINACHDLLQEGANGFSFSPLSVDEMAKAIMNFIATSEETKRSMSIKSLELVDLMSYEKMGHQLIEALETINNQKNKQPGLVASVLMNIWGGRYNTAGWDK